MEKNLYPLHMTIPMMTTRKKARVSESGILFLLFASLASVFVLFGKNTITAAVAHEVPAQGSIGVALALLTVALLYGAWLYFSPSERLSRRLQKIKPENFDKEYPGAYTLYMGLSEHSRAPFADRMQTLRQQLEEQVIAEKDVLSLLEQDYTSIAALKQNYDSIQAQWPKLPRTSQQRLYGQLVQLRQQLEHGK